MNPPRPGLSVLQPRLRTARFHLMLPDSIYAPPAVQYRDLRADSDLLVSIHEPDARIQHIPEAVIQDVWRCRRFDVNTLETTTGARVELLHPGFHNTDAGPDFTAARLRIGGLAWGGDVEVHRTSGEWIEHRHDADPRYNRVVLHVTLLADRHTGKLRRADGSLIPEVVLYPRLQDSLRTLLLRFYAYPELDFYCAGSWAEIPEAIKRPWIRTLGRERLATRKAALSAGFLATPDLDRLLYERVMRALGYAKNADPMETLARRLPLRRLSGLADRRDAEALLLGTAGLLPSLRDLLSTDRETTNYAMELRSRFESLTELSPVTPLQPTVWNRARLRASSLPTRRVVQAAALFGPGGTLGEEPLARIAEAAQRPDPRAALRALFTEAKLPTFWETHLRLDRPCAPGPAGIGRSHADEVIVNALLPALLLHAEQSEDPALEDVVYALYERIPAGANHVTRRYESRGSRPANALEAQGLHQLYRTRCTAGRCLSCPVGQHLLKGEN